MEGFAQTYNAEYETDNIRFLCRPMSMEEEIERVQFTLERYPWYQQHGYTKILQFPDHQVFRLLTDYNYENPEDLQALLDKARQLTPGIVDLEYDFKKYIPTHSLFIEERKLLSQAMPILRQLQNIWDFNILSNYDIALTQYGTGGSYNYKTGRIVQRVTPNGILMGRTPIMNTLHEMMHIGIENIIRAYGYDQISKESLVDSLVQSYLGHLLPGYPMQRDSNPDTFKYAR